MLYSPAIEAVDRLIAIPSLSSVDETAWHATAPDMLVPPEKGLPADILETGVTILRELPLEDLNDALSSPQSVDSLAHIHHIRKMLMIGRDAVMLSRRGQLPAAAKPILRLAKNLGKIADSKGQEPDFVQNSQRLTRTMGAATNKPLASLRPVKIATLAERIRQRLSTSELCNRSIITNVGVMHSLRVEFRRVVHLGVVRCMLSDNPQLREFLAEGRALNKLYGRYNDEMLGAAVTSDPANTSKN
jgi:hypothetical protein